MKILLAAFSLLLSYNTFAAECFTSAAQKTTYEQSLSTPAESDKITACLTGNIAAFPYANFTGDINALKKSGNMAAALPKLIDIFMTAKNPQDAFTATTALVSAADSLAPYQQQLLNVLSSSQLPDYKKTLATVILTAMGAVDAKYSPFLNPALKAEDPALRAYCAGAYSVLIPNTQNTYINDIILLYTFDKAFAQKAFESSALKQKALPDYLKAALKSPEQNLRIAAAEWLADLNTKKAALLLLDIPQSYKDSATLSAAANGLVKNYDLISPELRKALKASPQSNESSIAVLAYSFMGVNNEMLLEMLKKGTVNEKINASRIVSSVSAILLDSPQAFDNPELEKIKLTKLIAPVGAAASHSDNPDVVSYAEVALKEMYKLLNK